MKKILFLLCIATIGIGIQKPAEAIVVVSTPPPPPVVYYEPGVNVSIDLGYPYYPYRWYKPYRHYYWNPPPRYHYRHHHRPPYRAHHRGHVHRR